MKERESFSKEKKRGEGQGRRERERKKDERRRDVEKRRRGVKRDVLDQNGVFLPFFFFFDRFFRFAADFFKNCCSRSKDRAYFFRFGALLFML